MGIFPRNHCPASLLESSPEWYEMVHMPFPARLSGARLPVISALGRQERGVESLRPACTVQRVYRQHRLHSETV